MPYQAVEHFTAALWAACGVASEFRRLAKISKCDVTFASRLRRCSAALRRCSAANAAAAAATTPPLAFAPSLPSLASCSFLSCALQTMEPVLQCQQCRCRLALQDDALRSSSGSGSRLDESWLLEEGGPARSQQGASSASGSGSGSGSCSRHVFLPPCFALRLPPQPT